ncbi:MAG: hypothetical protein RSB61_00765, partial [Clostridia bacterium]
FCGRLCRRAFSYRPKSKKMQTIFNILYRNERLAWRYFVADCVVAHSPIAQKAKKITNSV